MPSPKKIVPEELLRTCPVPECGGRFAKGKAAQGHFSGVHHMNKAAVIRTFPDKAEDLLDLAPGWKLEDGVEPPPVGSGESEVDQEADVVTQSIEKLSPGEQIYFDERFEIIFQRVERDPDLLADVTSLIFCEIDIQKYRDLSRKRYENGDFAKVKIYEDLIKNNEDRRLKLMNSLGISRSKKLENKTLIKSSVSALISGFENEVELVSPEQLEAMVADEQKALAVMHERVNKHIVAGAAVIEPVSEAELNEPSLDFEAVVRDADLPF